MSAALATMVKKHGRVPSRPPAADRPVFMSSDEFVPDLVSTMFVEAITCWLEHGKPYTPGEIATRSSLRASALFKEASTWQ